MIGIVDYGLGNLGSIRNMLKKVGGESIVLEDPAELDQVSKIILPGVGAFDTGMRRLQEGGWIEPLNKKVFVDQVPVLGICLGMQLMTNGSEEGTLPGLGWVPGKVLRFRPQDGSLKVPHMGWNAAASWKTSPICQLEGEKRFYFVHSYYVELEDSEHTLFITNYGQTFVSGFEKDNVIGVQFHPEKSHKFGIHLFENFVKRY